MYLPIATRVSQLATLRIPADSDRLAAVRSFIRDTASAHGVRQEAVPDVVQAFRMITELSAVS